MGRQKNSLPSVAVIGLVILMIILYAIATHPLILIPIIGISIAVFLIYRNRKKNRELQYIEALRSMSVSDLDGLDGTAFERFLKTLFELDGYKVQLTKRSRDMGADLIVEGNGKTMAVQAKRYNEKVGVGAVQQIVSSINIYKTDGGIVITNSEFTSPAITLAKANGIELIDRGDLENLIIDVYKRRNRQKINQEQQHDNKDEVSKKTKQKKTNDERKQTENTNPEDPLNILRMRLAKGEITTKEFYNLKDALE